MTSVEKLESLIAEGWHIPLALFLVLSDLLPKHPEIWVNIDEGGEEDELQISVPKTAKRSVIAVAKALSGMNPYIDDVEESEIIYFVFDAR